MYNLQNWHTRAVLLGKTCSPEKIAAIFKFDGLSISADMIARVLKDHGVKILDVESDPFVESEVKPDIQSRYHMTKSANVATVDTSGIEVKTFDELVERMEIDPSEWIIPFARVGSHTTPIKLRSKPGGSQHAVVVTNYTVSAKLIRRKPIDLEWEPIAPVVLANPLKRKTETKHTKTETALLVSDMHIGYNIDVRTGVLIPVHRRKCIDTVLQVAESLKPEQIIFVGDMLDMAEWSTKWETRREMMFTTQAALVEALWWLTQFRHAAPGAKIVILEGNHDKRLIDSVQKNHIAAAGLRPADNINGPEIMSVERLMGLDSIDAEYISGYPDNAYYICDTLRVVHGTATGRDPTKFLSKRLEDITISEICGHSHKLAKVYKTDWVRTGPQIRYAMCCGCMVDIGGRIPKRGEWSAYNWQNGFGVTTYTRDTSAHCSEVHAIINDTCYYNNRAFVGRERAGDIFSDTGYYALRP